jgi:hypothetical protein
MVVAAQRRIQTPWWQSNRNLHHTLLQAVKAILNSNAPKWENNICVTFASRAAGAAVKCRREEMLGETIGVCYALALSKPGLSSVRKGDDEH